MDVTDVTVEIAQEYIADPITEKEFDVPLQELGFDSLDVIDFIFNLEKKFSVETSFVDSDISVLTLNRIFLYLKNLINN